MDDCFALHFFAFPRNSDRDVGGRCDIILDYPSSLYLEKEPSLDQIWLMWREKRMEPSGEPSSEYLTTGILQPILDQFPKQHNITKHACTTSQFRDRKSCTSGIGNVSWEEVGDVLSLSVRSPDTALTWDPFKNPQPQERNTAFPMSQTSIFTATCYSTY